MIDFVTIKIENLDPLILKENSLLNFCYNVNTSTGEIRTTNRQGKEITPSKNAFYKSLEFIIYDTGTILIKGSLHKFWNSGGHNYNDFNFKSFLDVLNTLKTDFNINPKDCVLKCLEVGVNINPPILTKDILEYSFLHKTKKFEYQIHTEEGKYKQCKHSQYIVKFYDKALHYKSKGFNINNEILRFEIKYTKMERVNKLGIFNLNDIKEIGFKIFENELLTEWQNVLFYDKTINSKSLRLTNYQNPIYWIELLEKTTSSNFNKHKNILNDLIKNNSENIKQKIYNLISEKIDFLNWRGASFDPLTIMSIHTPLLKNIDMNINKICLVTNINISMQKENSLTLSYSGLRYYYKNDKKVFEQIKRSYLSKIWINSDFETQIKEIAHNIRNKKSNQKIKQNRIYKPKQLNLLSKLELI